MWIPAPQGLCFGEQYVKSVQLFGSLGKSFDLCMRVDWNYWMEHLGRQSPGYSIDRRSLWKCRSKKPGSRIPEGETVHEVEQWKRDIELLASKKNVICKISGIVVSAPKDNWGPETLAPIINHCLDSFGPDRVIFGGDWPVCRLVASYKQWVTLSRLLWPIVPTMNSLNCSTITQKDSMTFNQLIN